MKKIHVTIICLALVWQGTAQTQKHVDLLIRNVNLIDGTGSDLQKGVDIGIIDGEIIFINTVKLNSEAAQTIDGSGKYLIPGFFDNHVHIGNEQRWPLIMSQFVHFGITSVLIPGTNNQKLLRFKKESAANELTMPHLYHTSLMTSMEGKHPAKTYGKHYIDGENVHYVTDETSIGPIIEQAVNDQAIALKLMIEDGPMPPFVPRIPERYVTMLSQKAHEVGLDFFAHVSDMDEVRIAINNNADALMHFVGVQINWENDLELMKKIAEQDVSWVSTAMIGKSFFYPLNKDWLQNEQYSLFSSDQTSYFNDETGNLAAQSRGVLKSMFGSDQIPAEALIKPMMNDLKRLYDMGVNIVVGTDLGGRPFIMPGYSFHEELELFQLGGFRGEEIIRCATLNAAKMLKVDQHYGSIEQGKRADFILLNANPLDDITNTLEIHQVYKEGILQSRLSN